MPLASACGRTSCTLSGGTLGFVNRATRPEYRLFLDNSEVHLQNFSNQLTEGLAVAKVTGRFMGSGRAVVGANFRPETKGPDFALAASIENTDMRTLNTLLRAYGKLDVVQGFFSVYTEMRVRNRTVRGYVKPLPRELDVYDSKQDQEKNIFQKLYEAVVGGVSDLLENTPREEVATKVDMAGPLEDPQDSTWQALVNLIQNAFFRAILPGFERELGRARR
jgi:pentatricopeptide repeat protein